MKCIVCECKRAMRLRNRKFLRFFKKIKIKKNKKGRKTNLLIYTYIMFISHTTRDLPIDIYHCSVGYSSRLFGDFLREIQACMKYHTRYSHLFFYYITLPAAGELTHVTDCFRNHIYAIHIITLIYTEQCVLFRVASFAYYLLSPHFCSSLFSSPPIPFSLLIFYIFFSSYVLQTICIREKRQSTATRIVGRGLGNHLTSPDVARRVCGWRGGELEKNLRRYRFWRVHRREISPLGNKWRHWRTRPETTDRGQQRYTISRCPMNVRTLTPARIFDIFTTFRNITFRWKIAVNTSCLMEYEHLLLRSIPWDYN